MTPGIYNTVYGMIIGATEEAPIMIYRGRSFRPLLWPGDKERQMTKEFVLNALYIAIILDSLFYVFITRVSMTQLV